MGHEKYFFVLIIYIHEIPNNIFFNSHRSYAEKDEMVCGCQMWPNDNDLIKN